MATGAERMSKLRKDRAQKGIAEMHFRAPESAARKLKDFASATGVPMGEALSVIVDMAPTLDQALSVMAKKGEKPNAGRFVAGGPPGNPKGRPPRIELARRSLQPLVGLGVMPAEIEALAQAKVSGDKPCWDSALAIIAARLNVSPAALVPPAPSKPTKEPEMANRETLQCSIDKDTGIRLRALAHELGPSGIAWVIRRPNGGPIPVAAEIDAAMFFGGPSRTLDVTVFVHTAAAPDEVLYPITPPPGTDVTDTEAPVPHVETQKFHEPA